MAHAAARSDANQAAIVQALRQCGCLVQSLHTVGRGVPDLLICYRGILALVEVKTRGGKLTKRQIQWHAEWQEVLIPLRGWGPFGPSPLRRSQKPSTRTCAATHPTHETTKKLPIPQTKLQTAP